MNAEFKYRQISAKKKLIRIQFLEYIITLAHNFSVNIYLFTYS